MGFLRIDIKPENFLLKSKGSLELSGLRAVDFGLSCFYKPGEPLNELVGSCFYVAPETLKV